MRIDEYRRIRLEREPQYAKAIESVQFEEDVADLVVSMRVAAGLSQVALARLAGTTQATISLIENGEANPRARTLAKIFAVLRVPKEAIVKAIVGVGSAASFIAPEEQAGEFVAPISVTSTTSSYAGSVCITVDRPMAVRDHSFLQLAS